MTRSQGCRARCTVALAAALGFACGTGGLSAAHAQGAPQGADQGQAAQPFGQGQPFGQSQPFGQGQAGQPFGQGPGQPQRQTLQPFGQGQPQGQAGQGAAGQGAGGAGGGNAIPALSQGSAGGANAGCDKLVELLTERKSIVARISESAKTKKMDAPAACNAFGKLIANGTESIKWMTANQSWCRIPEGFIKNVQDDNQRAATFRGQACKAAAQFEAMKKNPPQQMFGGNGLTGQMKIPAGAL